MPPKNSKPTNAQMLDAAWAALAARAAVKEPPPGSKSVYDFAKLSGKSAAAARYFLNAEVQAGRMECGNYTVSDGAQGHTVKLYTPKAKP